MQQYRYQNQKKVISMNQKQNDKELYLAVENKQGTLIDFDELKTIKKNVKEKVKRIKSEEFEEWISISVRELKEILCEDCFINLMGCFEE